MDVKHFVDWYLGALDLPSSMTPPRELKSIGKDRPSG
jgi:hypothetical protein